MSVLHGFSRCPRETQSMLTLPNNFYILLREEPSTHSHSELKSSIMLPILRRKDRVLYLENNLRKNKVRFQTQRPDGCSPQHCGDDSAPRDEKSSPRQCRCLLYRLLIPLCATASSTSGLLPGDKEEIPHLPRCAYISLCLPFSGFLGGSESTDCQYYEFKVLMWLLI